MNDTSPVYVLEAINDLGHDLLDALHLLSVEHPVHVVVGEVEEVIG